MCKVLAMAGIRKEKQRDAWRFVRAMAPIMSTNDNDGFGYAAITADGHVYGQRWLHNEKAFSRPTELSPHERYIAEELVDAVDVNITLKNSNFNEFGMDKYAPATAIIAHTRWATCEKGLKNTHPFVRNGTALIHNGVIRNQKELKNITSTCDSECILNEYLELEVNSVPENMEFLSASLKGYYACALLTKNKENKAVLDIFKSSTADLYCMFIEKLDTMIFMTDYKQARKACRQLKWKYTRPFKINSGFLIRLDAITGDRVALQYFDEKYVPYNGGVVGGSKPELIEGEEILDDDEAPGIYTYKGWETHGP